MKKTKKQTIKIDAFKKFELAAKKQEAVAGGRGLTRGTARG